MRLKIAVILILISAISLEANDQLRQVKINIDQLNNTQLLKKTAEAQIIQKTNAVWVDTSWLYLTRTRFTYLPNGKVDQEFEDAFGFSGWEDYNRWQYDYNQSELLENIYGETFNFSAWDSLDWKQLENYPDGKLKYLTRSVYTYPGWYPTQREIYEYNVDGQVSKQFLQQPISETEWYYTYLFETTYTPSGQVDELLSYVSDTGDSVWTLSYKLAYFYDAGEVEQEVVFSIWNSADSSWLPSSRTINTITDGKITEIKSQANYGSGWEDTERDLLEYDINGNLFVVQSQQYWKSEWLNTRLKTYEYDPASSINLKSDLPVVQEYQLYENYPNPFNPETTIKFNIPKAGLVNLQVYNVLGQSVATLVDKNIAAGEYSATFNADHLPSGIYFYRLQAENYQMTKRMILLK
jgi:hypothetical protein